MKQDVRPRALEHLLLALVLLTRLPLPHLPERSFQQSHRAVWAYPVVGAVLALSAGAVGMLLLQAGLPASAAAGLCLGLLVMATGAMHEDGLADMADGFWGSAQPERRLEIMKDSRIGAFGVLALIFVIGLRWSALTVLLPFGIGTLVTAAALSRAAMPVVMYILPHARADGLAKSVGRPGLIPVLLGLAVSTALGLALIGVQCFVLLGVGAFAVLAVAALARRKINGQTGDVLGALQVVSETAMLLALCVLTA